MGDSFSIERRTCVTPGCGTKLLFFIDEESASVPGQRALAMCPRCGQPTVLFEQRVEVA